MSVVILVPVLRRPHRVAPILASIAAGTPEPHRVLFITSPGDDAERDAIVATGAAWLELDRPPRTGDYARKINLGYRSTNEEFIFLGADDLHFHPGWLTAALAPFADPRIGVVGTQDLGNDAVKKGVHSTHSMVRRTYVDDHGTIDQKGKVLHEGYWHEFVDNEFVETARHRRAWAFASDAVVEHLHPHWGKAPTDALYKQFARRMMVGRALYNRRRKLWSGSQSR